MLLDRCSVKRLLVDDNKRVTLDYFKYKFYKNIEFNHQLFEEEQFDDLLMELYAKESEVYQEWYKLFGNIPYSFIKKYPVLTTCLVSNNNVSDLVTAYEMDKYRKALVKRSIPRKANVTNIADSKNDLIIELNMQLALLHSELDDNILRKAQEDFYNHFGEYENCLYLGDLYNDIIDSLETDIRNALIGEINKVNSISNRLTDYQNIGLIIDTKKSNKKDRFSPRVYRKY